MEQTDRKQRMPGIRFTGRWGVIIGGSVIAAILGSVLQIASANAQAEPEGPQGAIYANSIVGALVGIYALYLFTNVANANEKPSVVKALGIGIGIYALAQATTAVFML